ncbi:hypothetical protein LCGC14_1112390 [marine sediment metagenome]|uniref:LamG-like jellyroll fold domain-containing protein n=1 Tax=marine sediment metagenome TaxID=412755 RepID=A0A0F9M6B2_9ZZZZ
MARTFVEASSESLVVDSTPVTAHPLTMACWFKAVDITDTEVLMWLGDKDVGDDFWRLEALGSFGGDPIGALAQDGAGNRATTSTGFSAGTWHHACGVFTNSSLRAAYLDGGGKGTDTGVKSPDNADRIAIGASADSTPSGYCDADIAECAIWNVALTDAEVARLAQAFSPKMVRLDALVFYAPLIRDEDRDIIGGLTLTPTGTPTISPHTRMIYPPSPSFSPALAASFVIRWNDRGGIVLQTDANWGGAHFFEATLRATKGTMYARLTTKAGVPVADSQISTTSSTRTRVRSAEITLSDATEYVVQTGWVPGTDQGFANRLTILTI